jgi:hypothetical protein
MPLDEGEAVFTRRPESIAPELLTQLPGVYETAGGVKLQVVVAPDGALSLVSPALSLIHLKGLLFRHPRFSDATVAFVMPLDFA